MNPEEKKLLKDIEDAIIAIDEHLEGKRSFEEFVASKTKRRAVERELEIIGVTSKLMSSHSLGYKVTDRQSFIDFLEKFHQDLLNNKQDWEN